jgi:hypothetical protein
VNLDLPEGTTLLGVEVHDITGRLVAVHSGESTAIDLSHQPPGHYLLTILTRTGRTMHHLVKW